MPKLCLSRRFGAVALFLADHADALAAEAAEAADQRLVLGEFAVAGQRREFGDQRADEIGQMRPLRMPRDQGLLPRRQVGVELAQRLGCLVLIRPISSPMSLPVAASARSSSTLASSSATGFSKSR